MKRKLIKSASKINGLLSFQKVHQRVKKKPGEAPGTAVHTGQKVLDNMLITVHDFDESHYISKDIKNLDEAEKYLQSESKTWIQVRGLHDVEKLQPIWKYFNLHPLVEEDIVNTTQRPKVEPYDEYVFIVLRLIIHPKPEAEAGNSINEQVSIILGENYVLTFQESDAPIFAPITKRLETVNTRLRKLGPDYLAYALIDCIVDHYFASLETIDETIEQIEVEVIENPQKQHLQHIHSLRSELMAFRKSVWSLRDGLNSLLRDESPLVSNEVKLFTRDVYDHLVQVIETLENSREMVYSLYDMYMSNLSNKMNEVMKVLTIIATIFIPLTFIAGIYGMNFNPENSPWNMPELNWYWGYPFSLILMILMVAAMVIFFRRKKWL
jgi:magnesium transporter